ncbi:MAG: hypothetical protein KDE48_13430 [Anaerolineales bacterium]|nr:hypothetical protein [Anaerolineales bacterium]
MKSFIKKVYACEKESAALWIANALFWAAVIIIGSWLSRGSTYANAFYFIILSVSTTAFLFIERQRKNK